MTEKELRELVDSIRAIRLVDEMPGDLVLRDPDFAGLVGTLILLARMITDLCKAGKNQDAQMMMLAIRHIIGTPGSHGLAPDDEAQQRYREEIKEAIDSIRAASEHWSKWMATQKGDPS
jgi:hypothetical protein